MLQDLKIPLLQDRRKDKRLTFLYKIVEGLIPAIPADPFLTPLRNKRQIKTTNRPEYTSSNFVERYGRNNSRCFVLDSAKTDTHRNSFFIRTVSEWNNLPDNVVCAKSVEEFHSLLLTTKLY
jgi:hypothetical protein